MENSKGQFKIIIKLFYFNRILWSIFKFIFNRNTISNTSRKAYISTQIIYIDSGLGYKNKIKKYIIIIL